MTTDNDNQPIVRDYNAARLNDRVIDELIGLCKGIIADNTVSQTEAEFLQQWIKDNRHISNAFPANMIYHRIQHFLSDDTLDAEEADELLTLLKDLTGGGHKAGAPSLSSSLPLCHPAPDVTFKDKHFCLTGKFVTGSRAKMQEIVCSLGGTPTSSPSRKVSYLVIGEIGSRDWIHSTHGRKIEQAMELRDAGQDIAIISEEHWIKYLTAQ